MLTQQSLYALFDLNVASHAPLIEIYTEQPLPRLNYVCQFIFEHALNAPFRITHDVKEFEASSNLKINYSETVLAVESYQIMPSGLLQQKGISEAKPTATLKNEMIYFYPSGAQAGDTKRCDFDIFSAVFYCISRMEEWQKYEQDVHKRFEAPSSFLYQQKFHLKPLADIWVEELRSALKAMYPEVKFPEKKFKTVSTIDVDNLFAYKAKGWLRTLGASAKDILKRDFLNLRWRWQVVLGRKQDPFDVYKDISEFCFEERIPLIWFFLFNTGNTYDRTVNPQSNAFLNVFKDLKENHALFGLHPSYYSAFKNGILKNELKNLSQKSKEPITLSRQHYLRFDIRTTPNLLLKEGIIADFTMGFASYPGFRAGTSRPFHYYDFKEEAPTELLFVPFCAMDGAYTVYDLADPDAALNSMLQLATEVKKVKGVFVTVFHERTFFDHLYMGYGTLYKKLHSRVKEL